MPTSQQILDDINLRYRNVFTTDQKLVWFNEEQRELFDVLELDSSPYTFQTIENENFYPFPSQFDVTKIKTVTYQSNTVTNPDFIEIPFARNDDNQYPPEMPWYTIVSDTMYLYVPSFVPDDRTVYIYCDSDPDEVTTANLNAPPNIPTKYQEILKLGVLKRITMARKDVQMYNNYLQTYEGKIEEVMWEKRLKEPEWITPIDFMPSSPRLLRGTSWGRWPTTSP